MFHVEQYKMFHVEHHAAALGAGGAASASPVSVSSFGGRGRGFGISGLRQQLFKQLP